MFKKFLACLLISVMLIPGCITTLAATPSTETTTEEGELVVCFASKGNFDRTEDEIDDDGMFHLANIAHKNNIPVTWIIKPPTAEIMKDELKNWHNNYGDEVAWFSQMENPTVSRMTKEYNSLQEIIDFQKITTVGDVNKNETTMNLYDSLGITAMWGRCYEQTFSDGISDRGSGFGFFYAKPDCYKVPNSKSGGIVSVPWLTQDINLAYRTGWQEIWTYDPNDSQMIGAQTKRDIQYWKESIQEFKKQTKYNKVVPVVIQQEYAMFSMNSPSQWDSLSMLDEFFKYLNEEGIKVVTVAEAVEKYKAAYSETPPTYAIYDNLSTAPELQKTDTSGIGYYRDVKLVTERIVKDDPKFADYEGIHYIGTYQNGYTPVARCSEYDFYYNPDGKTFYEQPTVFVYYDTNGMMMIDKGSNYPQRITSYLDYDVVPNNYGASILPEFSYWFDTDKYIPTPTITETRENGKLKISFSATNNAVDPTYNTTRKVRLPYGIMLWGNYSDVLIPDTAPLGTKVLSTDGLFMPVVLEQGVNEFSFEFELTGKINQPEGTKAEAIELSAEEVNVAINGTVSVRATVKPHSARLTEVIWSSSNPEVATVSGDVYGIIKGISTGRAIITATTKDGKISSQLTVNVNGLQSVNFYTIEGVDNCFRGAVMRNTTNQLACIQTSITLDTSNDTYLHYDLSNRRGFAIKILDGENVYTVNTAMKSGNYSYDLNLTQEGVYHGKINLTELGLTKSVNTTFGIQFLTSAKGSTTVREFSFGSEDSGESDGLLPSADIYIGGGTVDKPITSETKEYNVIIGKYFDEFSLDIVPLANDVTTRIYKNNNLVNCEEYHSFSVNVGDSFVVTAKLTDDDGTTQYTFNVTRPEGPPQPEKILLKDLGIDDVETYWAISSITGGAITQTSGDDEKSTWHIDENGITFNPLKNTWAGFTTTIDSVDLTDPTTVIEIDVGHISGGNVAVKIWNKNISPFEIAHVTTINQEGKTLLKIQDLKSFFSNDIDIRNSYLAVEILGSTTNMSYNIKSIKILKDTPIPFAYTLHDKPMSEFYARPKDNGSFIPLCDDTLITGYSTGNSFSLKSTKWLTWGVDPAQISISGYNSSSDLYMMFDINANTNFTFAINGFKFAFNPIDNGGEATEITNCNDGVGKGKYFGKINLRKLFRENALTLPQDFTLQIYVWGINGSDNSPYVNFDFLGFDTNPNGTTIGFDDYIHSASFTPGDSNQDGNINVKDLVRMKKMIVSLKYKSSSDINKDKRIDSLDLTELRKLLLNIMNL